ncbi:transmembrane protein, putative [Medicago truncatula]|uniref:Transmembrane protein, putative n=1 Tax=Medicago truncatula TaxID=3880 RepID=G7ZXF5_MEDTR|nr:transmembrane protein, putative [Medicago truncatula]
MLVDRNGLWYRVLVTRYDEDDGVLNEGGWRASVGGEWFSDCVTKVVGNGRNTYFWTDPWLGVSIKHCTVEDMYVLGWEEGGEAWQWRRRLWDWEKELVGECRAMLANVTLQVTKFDEWRWRLDNSTKYYVRSVYDLLTSGGNSIVDEASTLVWHKQIKCGFSFGWFGLWFFYWIGLVLNTPTLIHARTCCHKSLNIGHVPLKGFYSCLEATSQSVANKDKFGGSWYIGSRCASLCF